MIPPRTAQTLHETSASGGPYSKRSSLDSPTSTLGTALHRVPADLLIDTVIDTGPFEEALTVRGTIAKCFWTLCSGLHQKTPLHSGAEPSKPDQSRWRNVCPWKMGSRVPRNIFAGERSSIYHLPHYKGRYNKRNAAQKNVLAIHLAGFVPARYRRSPRLASCYAPTSFPAKLSSFPR